MSCALLLAESEAAAAVAIIQASMSLASGLWLAQQAEKLPLK